MPSYKSLGATPPSSPIRLHTKRPPPALPEQLDRLLDATMNRAHMVALLLHMAAALLQETDPISRPQDTLLTAQEAATLLGTTKHWMYRHASLMPFTVRLNKRTLRFSQEGIQRYLDQKNGNR